MHNSTIDNTNSAPVFATSLHRFMAYLINAICCAVGSIILILRNLHRKLSSENIASISKDISLSSTDIEDTNSCSEELENIDFDSKDIYFCIEERAVISEQLKKQQNILICFLGKIEEKINDAAINSSDNATQEFIALRRLDEEIDEKYTSCKKQYKNLQIYSLHIKNKLADPPADHFDIIKKLRISTSPENFIETLEHYIQIDMEVCEKYQEVLQLKITQKLLHNQYRSSAIEEIKNTSTIEEISEELMLTSPIMLKIIDDLYEKSSENVFSATQSFSDAIEFIISSILQNPQEQLNPSISFFIDFLHQIKKLDIDSSALMHFLYLKRNNKLNIILDYAHMLAYAKHSLYLNKKNKENIITKIRLLNPKIQREMFCLSKDRDKRIQILQMLKSQQNNLLNL